MYANIKTLRQIIDNNRYFMSIVILVFAKTKWSPLLWQHSVLIKYILIAFDSFKVICTGFHYMQLPKLFPDL